MRQACERAQRGIVTESQRAGQIASWLRQGCDLTHDLLNHAGDAEALALAPLVTHRLQVGTKGSILLVIQITASIDILTFIFLTKV